MRALGTEVVAGGRTFRDLAAKALPWAERAGAAWVHPFDDPWVMAGQAMVGLEIADALPDAAQVVVPIGGGGLVSGMAAALSWRASAAALVGVPMEGADAMLRSVAERRGVALDQVSTKPMGWPRARPPSARCRSWRRR